MDITSSAIEQIIDSLGIKTDEQGKQLLARSLYSKIASGVVLRSLALLSDEDIENLKQQLNGSSDPLESALGFFSESIHDFQELIQREAERTLSVL